MRSLKYNKGRFFLYVLACTVLFIQNLHPQNITNESKISFLDGIKDYGLNKSNENSKNVLKIQNRSRKGCLVRGDTLKKQIALTFDDGPTYLSKEVILLLNKYDAKATFFWLGNKLSKKKKTIKLAKKSGHLVANHSWDHQKGLEKSKEELWDTQVASTFNELKKYGIKKSKYYRPPYGAITQTQIDYLAEKGITTVLWSMALQDWVASEKSAEKLFEKFKNQIHNGAIVLLHDFDDDYSKDKLKAIEQILIYGKTNGFSFVTVDSI
jgi:peptidoglycan-N-acetylglucosamine deacetylase